MTQLRLVSGNSNNAIRNEKLSSVKCKMLRVGSSDSSLCRKVQQLEQYNARAAAVIERLVDDLLEDLEGRTP